jgi:DNA-binding transcriptional ArsR family regulator
MEMNEKILSKELIVAAEIYRLAEVKKEKVYYSKLVESLKGREKVKSPTTISKALDVLFDIGMIYADWERMEDGKWARVVKIAGESKKFIQSIYNELEAEEK